jgi:hypothetical protein
LAVTVIVDAVTMDIPDMLIARSSEVRDVDALATDERIECGGVS